jgi:hypothetical protein
MNNHSSAGAPNTAGRNLSISIQYPSTFGTNLHESPELNKHEIIHGFVEDNIEDEERDK